MGGCEAVSVSIYLVDLLFHLVCSIGMIEWNNSDWNLVNFDKV